MMKTSELIQRLQAAIDEHGDLDVCVEIDSDPYPAWYNDINIELIGTEWIRDGVRGLVIYRT